jgi:hypothetical protein
MNNIRRGIRTDDDVAGKKEVCFISLIKSEKKDKYDLVIGKKEKI